MIKSVFLYLFTKNTFYDKIFTIIKGVDKYEL